VDLVTIPLPPPAAHDGFFEVACCDGRRFLTPGGALVCVICDVAGKLPAGELQPMAAGVVRWRPE
jgi:hypothetical protein